MRARYSGFLKAVLPVVLVLAGQWSAEVFAQQSLPGGLPVIAPLVHDEPIGFFISDSTDVDGASDSDSELCRWALDDWVRHSEGRVSVTEAAEADARVRVYFVAPGAGRYGEMRPVIVDGLRGAEVYVRADTDTLGPDIAPAARNDPLLRETIVYLTCLHEIGHALGMFHTDRFEDVMYYFGFGGDIPAFFGRYRNRLEQRSDIAGQSGLSSGDIDQLLTAYAAD